MDLVDSSYGWILTDSCSPPVEFPGFRCQHLVARTADGGMSWSEPVAVGPPTDTDPYGRLRFLNRLDGFVYGFSAAFVTHDGGEHWADAGLQAGAVIEIVGRGNTAWAVTIDCDPSHCMRFAVKRSTDGGRSWSPPHMLSSGPSEGNAIAFGDSGLVV